MPNLQRPKVSIYIATSIDGFIAKKDHSLDWLERFKPPPDNQNEDYGYQKFMASVDTLVMGKNTYKIASSVDEWPYQGKRVIVLSSTLRSVCKQAELFAGDIVHLIKKLHTENVKHIYADGGITISQFFNAGFIDSMTISRIPVILGSGIPLFSNLLHESWCQLVSSNIYINGLAQLTYELRHSSL
ncbi:MAG: RibD C-terminal protein [Gammaproteobacteria bacterium]|jgi:dihydrofolate reductase|nr:RibD C-terminal protein [Gammaproteobacteria bacterium]